MKRCTARFGGGWRCFKFSMIFPTGAQEHKIKYLNQWRHPITLKPSQRSNSNRKKVGFYFPAQKYILSMLIAWIKRFDPPTESILKGRLLPGQTVKSFAANVGVTFSTITHLPANSAVIRSSVPSRYDPEDLVLPQGTVLYYPKTPTDPNN